VLFLSEIERKVTWLEQMFHFQGRNLTKEKRKYEVAAGQSGVSINPETRVIARDEIR
jgi:hypothetical protein